MPRKKTPAFRRGYKTRSFVVEEDGSIRGPKRKWEPWVKEQEHNINTEESQDPSVTPPVTDVDCQPDLNNPESCNIYERNRDRYISAWDSVRQQLFSAFIEEQAPPTGSCQLCIAPATSRCLDCGPGTSFCLGCLKDVHASNVLHLPEVIVEGVFHIVQITKLLERRHKCSTSYLKALTVWDDKGRPQDCQVKFCNCEPPTVTLVRLRLWPASPVEPTTAFTFELLDWWAALQLEGHVATKTFSSVVKLKNSHLKGSIFSPLYKALIQESCEEYRHFLFQKRYNADISPSNFTSCPACPKDSGAITFSMDANFGLVQKRSSTAKTKPKHHDLLFCDQAEVDDFVQHYLNKPLKGNDEGCSDFNAGDIVRRPFDSKKLHFTGVFGSVCKHEIPIKFFSLRHGERLAYPVFLLQKLDSVLHKDIKFSVMYDIACVMASHFKLHKDSLPARDMKLAIPLFHVFGHRHFCQVTYSPRCLAEFGLTDGEAMERLWSFLRPFSKITKEMTDCHRVDLLTDALLHYREKKLEKIGDTLCQRLVKAERTVALAQQALHQQIKLACDHGSVTEDDVKNWADESGQPQQNSSHDQYDWQMKYAETLKRLQDIRMLIATTITTCDEEKLQSEKKKLETAVSRIEKKHRIPNRWDSNSELFCDSLYRFQRQRREDILHNLLTKAKERQYMSSLRAKYPDGQKVAVRLSWQMKKLTSSMKKLIGLYNRAGDGPPGCLPATLSFDEIVKPDHKIYLLLESSNRESSDIPQHIQEESVAQYRLLERGKEEIIMVQQEMSSVLAFFVSQMEELHVKLSDCDEHCGRKSLLYHKWAATLGMCYELRDAFHLEDTQLPEFPSLPMNHDIDQYNRLHECKDQSLPDAMNECDYSSEDDDHYYDDYFELSDS